MSRSTAGIVPHISNCNVKIGRYAGAFRERPGQARLLQDFFLRLSSLAGASVQLRLATGGKIPIIQSLNQNEKFMRQTQQKNRMRGRGRKQPNPMSRSFESNGPDVKIRGNASHIAEKYTQLARDAISSGDIVMAENYLQHAEHYNRIIAVANANSVRDGELNGGIRQQPEMGGFDDDEEDENDDPRHPQSPRTSEMRQPNNDRQDGRQDNRQDGRQDGRQDVRNDGRDRQDQRPRQEYRERPDNRSDNRNDNRNDNRPQRQDNRDRFEQRPDNRGNDNRGNDNLGNDNRGNEIRGNDNRERNENRGADRPEYRERNDNRDRSDNRERNEGRNQQREPRPVAPMIETEAGPVEMRVAPEIMEQPEPKPRRETRTRRPRPVAEDAIGTSPDGNGRSTPSAPGISPDAAKLPGSLFGMGPEPVAGISSDD